VTKEKKIRGRDPGPGRVRLRSLGKKFADPSPEVSRNGRSSRHDRAYDSQGFADLMDTMWPEMLKAMPSGWADDEGIGKLARSRFMFALMKPCSRCYSPSSCPDDAK